MKELFAALVKAQAHAEAAEKSSFNTHQKYKYASAEEILKVGRKALNQADLAVYTDRWETVPPESYEEGYPYRLVVVYTLVHGPSGESKEFTSSTPVIPGNGRPADKAEMSALTVNLAYFLRNLLLLPREDEETSVDQRDDRGFVPQKPNAEAMEASIKALEEAADHATLKALLDAAKPVGFDKQPTWRAAYVKRFEELKKAVQA